MCSSILQLTTESRDLSPAEKRITEYSKLSELTNLQQFSLKITTLFIQDNFEIFFYLLSFTLQLLSSQLEINHEVQESTEVN